MSAKKVRNTATGTVAVKLGSSEQVLRFNLNTFAIFQKMTGQAITDFNKLVTEDPIGNMSKLCYAAYHNECDRNDVPEADMMSERKFNALLLDNMDVFNDVAEGIKASVSLLGK